MARRSIELNPVPVIGYSNDLGTLKAPLFSDGRALPAQIDHPKISFLFYIKSEALSMLPF